MNRPIFSFFAGALGHWDTSSKALKVLCIAAEALAVIANLGEQTWSQLVSGARQRTTSTKLI
jgi:hypothetical protein